MNSRQASLDLLPERFRDEPRERLDPDLFDELRDRLWEGFRPLPRSVAAAAGVSITLGVLANGFLPVTTFS